MRRAIAAGSRQAFLALILPLAAAGGCTPEVDAAAMDADRALAHCKAGFEDFEWRHDIGGTIFISVKRPSRLSPGQLACMDRWASRAPRHHIFAGKLRPLRRSHVLDKAAICGLDPERDLAWTGPARDRAVIRDRGSDPRAVKCLWDWAQFVDAPVDLPPSKS
jgi:hypothetical protein